MAIFNICKCVTFFWQQKKVTKENCPHVLVLSEFLIFLTKIIKLISYIDFPRNDFLTLKRLKFRNALTQCAGNIIFHRGSIRAFFCGGNGVE